MKVRSIIHICGWKNSSSLFLDESMCCVQIRVRCEKFQVTGVNMIQPTLQPARSLIDIFPRRPFREKRCATCFPTLAISRYRSTFNAPWSRPAASWLAIAICARRNCGDTAACTVCRSLLSRPPSPTRLSPDSSIRSRALCYAKQNRVHEINPCL